MLNKKIAKCLKFGCSFLSSMVMLGGSALAPAFAATLETTTSGSRYKNLSVIVESKDETVPSDATFTARFIEDDDLDFQASEFDGIFALIDNSSKKGMEKIGVFKLSMLDANNQKIEKFDKNVSVLIEVPKDFDAKEVEVCYTKDGEDEHFEETVVSRNGKSYIAFETNHFSPYVLIDKETKGTFYSILGASIVGVIVAAGLVAYVMYKKKLNEKTS